MSMNMTDEWVYNELTKVYQQLGESTARENTLSFQLKVAQAELYILRKNLEDTTLEQIELLNIINEQINK